MDAIKAAIEQIQSVFGNHKIKITVEKGNDGTLWGISWRGDDLLTANSDSESALIDDMIEQISGFYGVVFDPSDFEIVYNDTSATI